MNELTESSPRSRGCLAIGLIAFAVLFVLLALVVCAWLLVLPAIRHAFILDFEKVGGTRLVYQVDPAGHTQPFKMDKLSRALTLRLDPAGYDGVRVSPNGEDRVEILLPGIRDAEVLATIKSKITMAGGLEFRILANEKHDGEQGNRAIKQAREKFARDEEINFETESGRQKYQWVKIFDKTEIDEFGRTPGEAVAVQDGYVLTIVPDESTYVSGDDLSGVEPTQDRQRRPAVGFHFNAVATRKFARLTWNHQPEADGFRHKLAIILDGKVMSAPAINSPIESGDGIIEGEFTAQKVQELVDVLNAGKLPISLLPEPVEEEHIPPKNNR